MTVSITILVVAYMTVAGVVVAAVLLLSHGQVRFRLAAVLGMLSLTLSLFQFIPQLWRTWRQQRVGALSIPAMLMQVGHELIDV